MAVLYWPTPGAGETVLPTGERVVKDEQGRAEVPDAWVPELLAHGYSETPAGVAAHEQAVPPADGCVLG